MLMALITALSSESSIIFLACSPVLLPLKYSIHAHESIKTVNLFPPERLKLRQGPKVRPLEPLCVLQENLDDLFIGFRTHFLLQSVQLSKNVFVYLYSRRHAAT